MVVIPWLLLFVCFVSWFFLLLFIRGVETFAVVSIHTVRHLLASCEDTRELKWKKHDAAPIPNTKRKHLPNNRISRTRPRRKHIATLLRQWWLACTCAPSATYKHAKTTYTSERERRGKQHILYIHFLDATRYDEKYQLLVYIKEIEP